MKEKIVTLKFAKRGLTMRRPKVLDVIASIEAAESPDDQPVCLIANLCMISPAEIEELDAADFRALNDAFSDLVKFKPLHKQEDKIKLQTPLEIAGDTKVEYLSIRRPKVRDIKESRKASNVPQRQETALLAALSGMPEEDILKLDWSDFMRIKGVLDDFLA